MHLPSSRVSRRTFWSLIVIAAFFWAAKYHPFLAAPRVIDDDARQHVYWTYRFQDPSLFRNDLLTTFISSPKVAPPGYQALYAVATRFVDPLLFSQLLSLGLLVLSIWLMLRIGQHLGAGPGSVFATVLFLLYFLYSSSGGLPKSFALPLLLGGVDLLLRRAFGRLAVLLVVQSVFYPPILLNTGALAAAMWLRVWWRRTDGAVWRHFAALSLGTAIAAGVLFQVYFLSPSTSFGAQVTRQEAQTMAEFSAQGRSAFYSKAPLRTLLNDRWGLGADRLYGFAAILGILALLRRPRRLVVPEMAIDLLWTSLGWFGLAHLVLFKLHLPSRYVLYTLPLAALVLIAVNSAGIWQALRQRQPMVDTWTHWLTRRQGLCWTGIGILACGFVYVQNRYIVIADPLTIRVDRPALQLYDYLQTLPADVVIAGHPLEMDNVPLFARRIVLANQELSLPYFQGYYTAVRQRLLDTFTAYYAADAEPIRQFVQRYGVDYILLNRTHFTPAFLDGMIYYEPFNSLIKQRLPTPSRFALLDNAVGERVYVRGPYILVSFTHVKKGPHGGTSN